jgi:predicted regulator of Ras-like GTPase activity (Roadblock/LC7/MglB family)
VWGDGKWSGVDNVALVNTLAAGVVDRRRTTPGMAPEGSIRQQGGTVTASHQQPGGFSLLITDFVRRVPGAAHAVVVSADGLLLAPSDGLPQDRSEQLSAVASGLVSLTQGAARCFEAGAVNQTVVEMERGYLFIMSVSDGSCLAVLAAPSCDIGTVAYEMTLLVDRVGQQITPELRAQLRGGVRG